MTYEEARAYLEAAGKKGMVFGLEAMRALLARLGNPEKSLRFLHIAGTNGKGSVLAFCCSVLTECGYRTGAYTSPAVFSYEEHFLIDGKPMEKKRLPDYVKQVQKASEELSGEGIFPTAFELETAVAFLYFKEEQCDIVVLEAGLGGREDATNVVENVEVSVITSIALDHTAILGKTLEEIASHKAGIIKRGVPVAYRVTDRRARAVIEEEAEKKSSPLRPVNEERLIVLEEGKELPDGRMAQVFTYKYYEKLEIPLLGRFQPENAALAVEALETLSDWGYNITEKQIRNGLLKAVWPGRFELLSGTPQVVLDGAHNPDGVRALLDTVKYYFPVQGRIAVMGVLADKNYKEMVRMAAPFFRQVYTVTPNSPRALSAEALKDCIKPFMEQVTAMETVEEAVETAVKRAKPSEVVILFGSLSFLGQAKEALTHRKG